MSIERAAIGSPQNAPQTDKDDRLHMVYGIWYMVRQIRRQWVNKTINQPRGALGSKKYPQEYSPTFLATF